MDTCGRRLLLATPIPWMMDVEVSPLTFWPSNASLPGIDTSDEDESRRTTILMKMMGGARKDKNTALILAASSAILVFLASTHVVNRIQGFLLNNVLNSRRLNIKLVRLLAGQRFRSSTAGRHHRAASSSVPSIPWTDQINHVSLATEQTVLAER